MTAIPAQPSGVVVRFPGLLPFFLEHGKRVRINKVDMPMLPRGFVASTWSLPLGERQAYRDGHRRDSLQLREFDDWWLVEVDHYNPDVDVLAWLAHAVVDAPEVTIGVAAGLAVLGGVGSALARG